MLKIARSIHYFRAFLNVFFARVSPLFFLASPRRFSAPEKVRAPQAKIAVDFRPENVVMFQLSKIFQFITDRNGQHQVSTKEHS
ncbi:MAG: hypothetical protein ACI4QA_07795 [Candidatus Spyradosoma sp.]